MAQEEVLGVSDPPIHPRGASHLPQAAATGGPRRAWGQPGYERSGAVPPGHGRYQDGPGRGTGEPGGWVR